MSESTIGTMFTRWRHYNQALRAAVADLTDEQLAARPTPDRWPLWATVGHLACQRVSGLCGEAGEPGAEGTPFPDALYRCPGDEYLEPAMESADLTAALDSTFRIIERCLDTWTFRMLEEIPRTPANEERARTRGAILQHAFAHDIYHAAEVNEALSAAGLPLVDLWA